ncbi:zf-CCHC domain-containing protein [Tanacetum coccineum]
MGQRRRRQTPNKLPTNLGKSLRTSPLMTMRFNDFLSRARAGKTKRKTYNISPKGRVYDAILRKMITRKEDIGGNFEIPCNIGGQKGINALVDQGSNVNVIPYTTYMKLTDERPVETDIRLSLASHSYIYPLGIAEDVLVDVAEHMLYLMRRSLEVLRKFHWMILGGRSNQFSHVSSPLLSKPGEYFNTIITSLKALDESILGRNHVKKFLRALPTKWHPKVMAIEESKDLSTLPLDEFIDNINVYEVVLEKDLEISKNKKEKYKPLALKARKVISETSSDSDDEEYAMAVRDFKKFFRRRGKFVCQPYDDKKNFQKVKEDKKEKDD